MSKKKVSARKLKTARQAREITGLLNQNAKLIEQRKKDKAELARQTRANRELQWLMDSTLVCIGRRYGERVEENGELLGWRMEYPPDEVATALRDYEVRARQNEDGNYVIAVMPRDTGGACRGRCPHRPFPAPADAKEG